MHEGRPGRCLIAAHQSMSIQTNAESCCSFDYKLLLPRHQRPAGLDAASCGIPWRTERHKVLLLNCDVNRHGAPRGHAWGRQGCTKGFRSRKQRQRPIMALVINELYAKIPYLQKIAGESPFIPPHTFQWTSSFVYIPGLAPFADNPCANHKSSQGPRPD